MAIGDIYRLSAQWVRTVSGDDAVNIFHFEQRLATVFDTAGEDLVEAFIAQCVDNYKSCVSPAYKLKMLEVRQVTGGDEIYEQAQDTAGAYGASGTQLATQVSCLISWRTGLAGRRKRGRTYLPAADEGAITDGLFATGYTTIVQAFIDDMLGMGAAGSLLYGDYRPVIWSAVDNAATPITQGLIRTVPSTMKSRKIGSGS